MIEKVTQSLKKIPRFTQANFLLAVSGGVDSMVLLHIFNQLNLSFSVAHCNFNLRGEASDLDEELVMRTSKKLNIPFFHIEFDTLPYKNKKGVSTQMAARELRYDWFNQLKKEHRFDYIVTAHHLDDNIETVFLNLSRGTGINGISGMEIVGQSIFRPLLEVSKKEILRFSEQNNIPFREDESNESDAYKRNKLRNQILPLFQELNPNFVETMKSNISQLQAADNFYKKAIETETKKLLQKKSDSNFSISIEELFSASAPKLILFEVLNGFGFNSSQIDDLFLVITKENSTGKEFLSASHRLLVDRNKLLISTFYKSKNEIITINFEDKFVTYPTKLTLKYMHVEDMNLKSNKNLAFLDADKINFPLQLRKWKMGDRFSPMGMKGVKKISDFLIDAKLSRFEKEKVYVLESNRTICWLVGHRIDNSYKITPETKNVLRITVEE